jgi:hypothetical protein
VLSSLSYIECGCGYHLGLDATHLDQVGDIRIPCPGCGEVIDTAVVVSGSAGRYAEPTKRAREAALKDSVFTLLVQALTHAERRLNDIPHDYADTDFALIRRALRGAADVTDEHPPYVTAYKPIGGWNSVLLSWDSECGCYTPYETGFNNTLGDGSREAAIVEAKSWALSEGLEYREPKELPCV